MCIYVRLSTQKGFVVTVVVNSRPYTTITVIMTNFPLLFPTLLVVMLSHTMSFPSCEALTHSLLL